MSPPLEAAAHTEGVFFTGPIATAPHDAVPPYASCTEHLEDELELCARYFERLPALRAQRRVGSPAALIEPDEAAARLHGELDARMAELRAFISRRLAASPPALELPLLRLAERFGLDRLALQVVLLILASELDPRPVAAITGGGPLTPSLLHELLAAEAPPRAAWFARFSGPASLLDERLVLRIDESLPGSLGNAPLRLHPRVLAYLLGQEAELAADGALARLRRYVPVGPHPDELALTRVLDGLGHCLWLVGSAKHGTFELAERLCAAVDGPLLEVHADAASLGDRSMSLDQRVRELRLWQRLCAAVLVVSVGALPAEPGHVALVTRFLRILGEQAAGPIVTLSEHPSAELSALLGGAYTWALPPLTGELRRGVWQEDLKRWDVALAAEQLNELANFQLGPGEIAEVTERWQRARGPGDPLDFPSLRQAAIARVRGRLNRLADIVVTRFSWNDLVLPEEELGQLEEILIFEAYRHRVLTEWDMAAKLPYGAGIAALFSGPPGTGKTMAASVLANALGRELHRVDLSRIVDKYIGETEKHLGDVFAAAREAHAVLLFDEADSLFGKRTEVSSSNDRYANLETNHLLQLIENHVGITVLTTNRIKGIDEAFLRRIQFRVEFPFPDGEMRARLWREMFTSKVPLAANIEFTELGRRFELSGGHIKAAAMRAIYHAAASDEPVTMHSLSAAAQIEYQGLGKLVASTR